MAPSTTGTRYKEKRAAWIAENPLRAWRKENGLAMMEISQMLGVAFSSVQQHEQGGYFPRDWIASYAKLMKVPEAKLVDEWTAWLDRAPSL